MGEMGALLANVDANKLIFYLAVLATVIVFVVILTRNTEGFDIQVGKVHLNLVNKRQVESSIQKAVEAVVERERVSKECRDSARNIVDRLLNVYHETLAVRLQSLLAGTVPTERMAACFSLYRVCNRVVIAEQVKQCMKVYEQNHLVGLSDEDCKVRGMILYPTLARAWHDWMQPYFQIIGFPMKDVQEILDTLRDGQALDLATEMFTEFRWLRTRASEAGAK